MNALFSQAWRSWKDAPGPAAFAIAALAVGIGCATAIFSVVYAIMLAPLPYSHGDRWLALFGGSTDPHEVTRISALSISDLRTYQARLHSFDAFGWFNIGGDYNLTSPGAPRHLAGITVTPSLIDNLGVSPERGRLFQEKDGANVALISHRLWQQLGSDARVLGRSITLDGQSYTVLGVMPASFRLPIVSVSSVDQMNDVWLPVKPPRNQAEFHDIASYVGYGRLKPGVTLPQAREDARRVAAAIAHDDPTFHLTFTAVLWSIRETVVREIRPVLLLLFAAAGLLLLITCANVAGLLVARAAGRAHETAIRLALGAGAKQLGVQMVFEGFVVSLAGAFLGVAFGVALVRMVVASAADFIPRAQEISLNGAVLLFALALACLTTVLSSLAPLWQAVRTQPRDVLNDGVRSTASVRSRRFSHRLVVAEIALAFTLLATGALLLTQLQNLRHTWPGFDPHHLLTIQMNLSNREHTGGQALANYQSALLQRLASIPGVTSAAVANQLPLAGCCLGTTFFAEGREQDPNAKSWVSLLTVSPDYLKTMRIPLRRGRFLTARDTNENVASIVVDEAAARQYWPNRDPIGAYGRFNGPSGSRAQVVGVVGDVRNNGLNEATRPEVYLLSALVPPNPARFIVRSNLAEAPLAAGVRRAVQSFDPAQPIFDVNTMEQIAGGSLSLERLNSTVMLLFAGAALLMAALGIYGVTSYSVRQRTVEMGTRRALGATGQDLLRLIIGGGLKLAGGGLVLGGIVMAAVTWVVMRSFHVHEVYALPYLYSTLGILLLASIASFFPAWRATLVTPMVAIRNDSDSIWAIARRGAQQVFGAASDEDDAAAAAGFDSAALTDLVEQSRRAGSFAEALSMALASVCRKIDAASAILLEETGAGNYRVLVQVPDAALPAELPATGFLLNRLRFYTSPLAFSAADLESAARWAAERKPQQTPEIEALRQSNIRLAVPLRTKKDIIGLLLFGARRDGRPYRSPEKRFLRAYAEQFALMIENARLTGRVLEQETMRRDVALAAEVQRRLLPEKAPETGAVALAAFTLAARTVGGDYYDYFRLAGGRLCVALADVAGKGVAAALIMAFLRASLRIFANETAIGPAALAGKMNHYLHASTGFNSYATFFYAEIDEQLRELRYVNAGHNPPYLLRRGQVEELSTGGTVIGMFPIASYEEAVVPLAQGDILLAFTDGVTEALNPLEEEFGEERLRELLARAAHLPAGDMTAQIFQELSAWIGGAAQHDDLTFIVMKVN